MRTHAVRIADVIPAAETAASPAGGAPAPVIVRFFAPGLPFSLSFELRDPDARAAAPQISAWIPIIRD